MINQDNNKKVGKVRYSESKIAKLGKTGLILQRGGMVLGIGSMFLIGGYILGGAFGLGGNPVSEPNKQEPQTQPSLSASSESTVILKNNFKTDNNYVEGEEIRVSDCDFSGMCVVLDAADETDALYNELIVTQDLLQSNGIDCVVTSYYDSAIDEIERIKLETGKTVFVASVQTNQNQTEQHLIATNYYNNSDALGYTTPEIGDRNSADAFALAVESSMPFAIVKKGLADDYTDYDRRASQLEQDIRSKGLEGVKAITIRTSEPSPLSPGELGNSLLRGIIKTSTLNNDQTYLVKPNSMDGYAVAGTIKDRYGYEEIYRGRDFTTTATVLTREKPTQLTNKIRINYGNPVEMAYQEVTGAKTR